MGRRSSSSVYLNIPRWAGSGADVVAGASTVVLGAVHLVAFGRRADAAVGRPSVADGAGARRVGVVAELGAGRRRQAAGRLLELLPHRLALALDADDARLADHGRPVARLGRYDEVALVLDDVVALVPRPHVGVPVVPRLRHRVQLEAARDPRLVVRQPQLGRVALRLLQYRLLARRQLLFETAQLEHLDISIFSYCT